MYWLDEHLSSKANIMSTNDEIIDKGPLSMAWDGTLRLLSSAVPLLPPRGLAGCTPTSLQQLDIRIILKEQRRQVSCYRYMAWSIVVSVVSCARHLLCERYLQSSYCTCPQLRVLTFHRVQSCAIADSEFP